MVSGSGVWFGWTAFFHAEEAKPLGICQALFDEVTLLGQTWAAIDPIVITLAISVVVMIILQCQYGRRQPLSSEVGRIIHCK
jgi:SSS family solute:Na+ symporter